MSSTVRTPTAERPTRFPEFSRVVLTRDVAVEPMTIPAGTAGVIVHCHDDGIGYEVEFQAPLFRVVTLTAADLEAGHG